MSSLNLPSFSLKPVPLVLWQLPLLKYIWYIDLCLTTSLPLLCIMLQEQALSVAVIERKKPRDPDEPDVCAANLQQPGHREGSSVIPGKSRDVSASALLRAHLTTFLSPDCAPSLQQTQWLVTWRNKQVCEQRELYSPVSYWFVPPSCLLWHLAKSELRSSLLLGYSQHLSSGRNLVSGKAWISRTACFSVGCTLRLHLC